jgi:hypothetical protein
MSLWYAYQDQNRVFETKRRKPELLFFNSPAAIRQNIPIPSLKLVRTADFVKHRLPRFQAQVVRIIEAKLTS